MKGYLCTSLYGPSCGSMTVPVTSLLLGRWGKLFTSNLCKNSLQGHLALPTTHDSKKHGVRCFETISGRKQLWLLCSFLKASRSVQSGQGWREDRPAGLADHRWLEASASGARDKYLAAVNHRVKLPQHLINIGRKAYSKDINSVLREFDGAQTT